MAILDFIMGGDIKEQKRTADRFVNKAYDSDQFLPSYEESRRLAGEGIDDASIRTQGVKQVYSSTNTPIAPVGQGSGLASLQRSDEARASAVADMETQIGIQEEQAKKQGRMSAAQIRTQMKQMDAKRIAGLEQNRLDMLAEQSRRKKALGSILGKAAGTIAGVAIPGIGTAAAAGIGALAGGVTGGAEGAVTGALSGATTKMEQNQIEDTRAENRAWMESMFGGNENRVDKNLPDPETFMKEFMIGRPVSEWYNYNKTE